MGFLRVAGQHRRPERRRHSRTRSGRRGRGATAPRAEARCLAPARLSDFFVLAVSLLALAASRTRGSTSRFRSSSLTTSGGPGGGSRKWATVRTGRRYRV